MREELLRLLELQKIDLEIDRRKQALAALDDGRAAKAQLKRHKAASKRDAAQRMEVEKEYFDQELKLRGTEDKKKKAEELMYGGKVANPRQLEDLQKEVAMFNREIDRLSTRVLELMDELEASRQTEAESKRLLEKGEAELEKITATFAAESARLKEDLKELSAQREESAAGIDKPLLARYEKIQSKLGAFAAVGMQDEVCGGCHVTLSSHLMQAVQEAKAAKTCESCGRILIWTVEAD